MKYEPNIQVETMPGNVRLDLPGVRKQQIVLGLALQGAGDNERLPPAVPYLGSQSQHGRLAQSVEKGEALIEFRGDEKPLGW